MERKINFNAGPATLPPEVLQQFADAAIEYNNLGMSILELPHRGSDFMDIIDESKAIVHELCGIGPDYEVIFLQGGGRMLFTMVPMNLVLGKKAAYIDSGHWSAAAIEYARHYSRAEVVASSADTRYDRLPVLPKTLSGQPGYLHYTTNNTIFGTQWHQAPEYNVPLVADMSSDIFCCKRDYNKFGLFYAAAQKNLGTPGIALTVIRKDVLEMTETELPPMMSFRHHVKENSVLNTANVSGMYALLLMLRWTSAQGLDVIEKENREKAEKLYAAIDGSSKFVPYVQVKADRSLMNVCFNLRDKAAEEEFIKECSNHNIEGIKGHRSAGGIRVSLYNAVPVAWVDRLVEVMQQFDSRK